MFVPTSMSQKTAMKLQHMNSKPRKQYSPSQNGDERLARTEAQILQQELTSPCLSHMCGNQSYSDWASSSKSSPSPESVALSCFLFLADFPSSTASSETSASLLATLRLTLHAAQGIDGMGPVQLGGGGRLQVQLGGILRSEAVAVNVGVVRLLGIGGGGGAGKYCGDRGIGRGGEGGKSGLIPAMGGGGCMTIGP